MQSDRRTMKHREKSEVECGKCCVILCGEQEAGLPEGITRLVVIPVIYVKGVLCWCERERKNSPHARDVSVKTQKAKYMDVEQE